MEGSYDPVFSGPSNPMNPSAPSGANQYKANVNRTKTRKWVEAKTVDYGGDDWGGDYDDEPYEPEAQPQPQPKPQGPRSSATLSNNQPPSPAGPRALQTTGLAARAASPASSSSPGFRTPVGAPALHIQTQQHPSTKPTTIDTGSPWRQGPPSRGSTPGIERPREISPHAVGVPQSATASSVYSAVAEFGQLYGDRAASPGPFQGPRPRRMSPGPQSVSSPVPTRFPRRKSSLGQQDAPADTVYSPTHADSNRQTGSRPGSSHTNPGSIMSANKPWMVEGTVGGPRSASPSGSMRSPTATGKPLPFVRPADIYKKLEDEKDKVRRSIDSGRPSMDSLGLGRGSDTAGSLRAQSPAGTSRNKPPTQDQAQVRPDSDVISPGLAGVTDVPFTEEVQVDSNGRKGTTPGRDDDDSIVPRSGRPGLPTVAERKSEYGIEGLIASYEARGSTSDGTSQPDASPLATTAESTSVPASREGVPAMSSATSRLSPRNEIGDDQADQGHQAREVTRLEKKEGAAREQALGSAHSQEKDAEQAQKGEELEDIKKGQSGEELRRLSTSPKLPELGRLSVFGFDLFSSSTSSNPPNPSSSFNLPTSSPPPPVPAIPSSHSIVSPGSPLSTVIESPSPSSSLPNQDDRLHQAQEVQGQAPRDQTWPDVDSRSQLPAPSHAISQPNYSGAGSTSRVPLSEHSSLRQPESSPDQHHYPSGESDPNSRPISAGQGARAQSSERPEPIAESVTNLHATSDTFTSKSESEQQPSEYKALPTLPSEASVVTPDPQASQLAISGPTAIGSDEHGSSEGERSNASSTANPKLAIHPLLAQHSGQAKAIPPQVSASSSSHATSASVPSPAPASKPTPVDNQVLPPPRLPGPLVTDYQSYLPSSSSDTAAVPSIQSADKGPSEESDVGSPVPKGQLTEGTVAGNASGTRVSPPQPSGTPPPPPVEITRGETYVTALESASQLEGGGSPLKSDKLSAEILRSLSPAAPNATTVAETSDAANRSSDGPSSAARESSFLPDLYDDYWSFAGEGNDTDPNDTPGVPTNPASDAMPAALNVQTDDSRPRSPVIENNVNVRSTLAPSPPAATPRSSVDVYKTDVQAVPVELHRPVLPNRFSWERDGIEAAKVDIQVEPKSLADKQQTSSTADTPLDDNTSTTLESAEPVVKLSRTPSPAPAYEEKGKAVADNRSPSPSSALQPSSTSVPPTASKPVPESSPRRFSAHAGPLTSNPVMAWDEIREVPSQTERIVEFNKARTHYAVAQTGLETILENFAAQHPDIVEASCAGGPTAAVYTYDVPSAQDVGGLLSPTALGTTPPTTRTHGNPTAQLGPKTKEFFATAGKASKGLFSTLKAKGKKVAS